MSKQSGYKTYDRTAVLSDILNHYVYYAQEGTVLVTVWPKSENPLVKATIVMDGLLYTTFYYQVVETRRQAAGLARRFLHELSEEA